MYQILGNLDSGRVLALRSFTPCFWIIARQHLYKSSQIHSCEDVTAAMGRSHDNYTLL